MIRTTFTGRLHRALEAASAVCLFVLMAVALADVVGRNLLNRPLPWGSEFLEIVLAAMVFLLYPVLGLRSEHITVDLIPVRAGLRRLQRGFGGLFGAAAFGLIAWALARQAIRAAGYGEATALLGMPLAYVLGGMSALAGLTVLAFLVAAWGPSGSGRTAPDPVSREVA